MEARPTLHRLFAEVTVAIQKRALEAKAEGRRAG
jgi:hypothetical protein